MANIQKPCFDFECQYLKNVISWGDDLCVPDVLLPKFVDNEFDGNIVYLIFSGLQAVVTMATYVSGVPRDVGPRPRCNRSQDTEENRWQMAKHGRIWSGSDLGIVTDDHSNDSKKLAKLLKSQIETMSKMRQQRKEAIKAFAKIETEKVKKSASQKNTFNKARKLDVEVQNYLKLMETEGQLRRQIVQKLEPNSRRLSTHHKNLLVSMIKNLRRFTRRMITNGDEPDPGDLSHLRDNIRLDKRNEGIESNNLLHFSSSDEENSPNVSRRNIT